MSVTLQALVWTLSQPAHSAPTYRAGSVFQFAWSWCVWMAAMHSSVLSVDWCLDLVWFNISRYYLFFIVLMVVYGWNVINIMNLKIQTQTWTSENMSCQPGVSSCLSQNGVLAERLKMLKTFHQYFIHDQQQQLDRLQDVEIPAGSGFSRERDHRSTDWGNSERKIFWWAF